MMEWDPIESTRPEYMMIYPVNGTHSHFVPFHPSPRVDSNDALLGCHVKGVVAYL